MPVIHITSEEQFNEYLNNKKTYQVASHSLEQMQVKYKYVLVDFYAKWCGPCKKISPTIEKFSEIYKSVAFLKVDVDELEDLTHSYKIRGMPTFLLFETGSTKPAYSAIVGADSTKIENLLKLVTEKAKPSDDF